MWQLKKLMMTDVLKNYSQGDKNGIINTNEEKHRGVKAPPPPPPNAALQSLPTSNTPKVQNPKLGRTEQVPHPKTSSADETGKSCELTYGSYCLWQQEHREVMKDAMVKKLKDQLFVARAYYPSIAKLPAQDKLSRQLKQNIQELEHVLSESSTDADLPPLAGSGPTQNLFLSCFMYWTLVLLRSLRLLSLFFLVSLEDAAPL